MTTITITPAAIDGHIVETPDQIGERLAAPIVVIHTQATDLLASVPARVERDTLDAANALYTQLQAFGKKVDKAHSDAKGPITAVGKIIDGAKRVAIDAIDTARSRLGGEIARVTREIQIERDAAIRAAREAEEAAARAAAVPEDDEDFGGFMGAPSIVTVPAAPPVVIPPPPPKSAVIAKTVWVAVIDSPDLVPVSLSGFTLRPVDLVAVKKALEAGVTVPGARLVAEETTAARGAR